MEDWGEAEFNLPQFTCHLMKAEDGNRISHRFAAKVPNA
jgi:hypothetical protein